MCLFLSLFGCFFDEEKPTVRWQTCRHVSYVTLLSAFRSCGTSARRAAGTYQQAAFSYHRFSQICWVITPPPFLPTPRYSSHSTKDVPLCWRWISIVWGTHKQRCDLIGCKSTIKGQVSHSLSHFRLAFGIPSNYAQLIEEKQFRKLEEKEMAWCALDNPLSKFNTWWKDSITPERQTLTSVGNYTFSSSFIFSPIQTWVETPHILNQPKN